MERYRDVDCDVYMCFVDFDKAFDGVQHRKLIDIHQNSEIDDKDVKIIAKLF